MANKESGPEDGRVTIPLDEYLRLKQDADNQKFAEVGHALFTAVSSDEAWQSFIEMVRRADPETAARLSRDQIAREVQEARRAVADKRAGGDSTS